jgi:hypothetical protein
MRLDVAAVDREFTWHRTGYLLEQTLPKSAT